MLPDMFKTIDLRDGMTGVVLDHLAGGTACIVEVFKEEGSVGDGLIFMELDAGGALVVCQDSLAELEKISQTPTNLLSNYDLGSAVEGG